MMKAVIATSRAVESVKRVPVVDAFCGRSRCTLLGYPVTKGVDVGVCYIAFRLPI